MCQVRRQHLCEKSNLKFDLVKRPTQLVNDISIHIIFPKKFYFILFNKSETVIDVCFKDKYLFLSIVEF
jgi:hypothetical protein